MKLSILLFFVYLFFQSTYQALFPNIIWMYWNVGEDMAQTLGKACFSRIRQINPNWEVRFIQDITLRIWLNQDQMKQLSEITQKQKIKYSVQTYSYFIRLMLLKKYGGVWLDAHTILLQNLNWVQDLANNNQVLNKIGDQPQAFVFFKNEKSQLGFYQAYTQNQTVVYPTIPIQISFIASVPQSQYIIDLLQQLKRVHLGGEPYVKQMKSKLVFQDVYTDYWTLHLTSAIIKYRQLRKYQQIMHKEKVSLDKAFYKVWTINRVKGLFYLALQYQDKANVNVLFRNIDQTYNKPKYAIKLTHFNQWQRVYKFLINQQYRVDYYARKSNQFIFDYGQMYLPDYLKCLYRPYVYQDSIINKYVINGSSIPYYDNLKVYKNNQLPWICSQTHLLSIYNHKNKILDFLHIPFLLLAFFQLFIQLTLKLTKLGIELKQQKLNERNKQKIKQTLYLMSTLFYIIALHYYYFKAEAIMWWYDSPYSIFICCIYLFMASLCLSYNLLSKQTLFTFNVSLKYFVLAVIVMCLFQLFILQTFGIWNSNAPLFHFQTLVKMNKQTLFEVINGLWKMSFMFCIGVLYFDIKNFLWIRHRNTIQKYIQKMKNKIRQKLKQLSQKVFKSLKGPIFQDSTVNQEKKQLTIQRDQITEKSILKSNDSSNNL